MGKDRSDNLRATQGYLPSMRVSYSRRTSTRLKTLLTLSSVSLLFGNFPPPPPILTIGWDAWLVDLGNLKRHALQPYTQVAFFQSRKILCKSPKVLPLRATTLNPQTPCTILGLGLSVVGHRLACWVFIFTLSVHVPRYYILGVQSPERSTLRPRYSVALAWTLWDSPVSTYTCKP